MIGHNLSALGQAIRELPARGCCERVSEIRIFLPSIVLALSAVFMRQRRAEQLDLNQPESRRSEDTVERPERLIA
jgi:hypothetical protein